MLSCLRMAGLLTLTLAGSAMAAEPPKEAEYALRLKPVIMLRLDESPTAEKGCFKDATGNTPGGTASAGKELPKQVDGGADWMGKGLEFVHDGASVFVPSTSAISKLGDTTETTGLSLSFWFKKEQQRSVGGQGSNGCIQRRIIRWAASNVSSIYEPSNNFAIWKLWKLPGRVIRLKIFERKPVRFERQRAKTKTCHF